MAKNKKEEKNKKQEKVVVKKKKHGCRNCLVSLLIFVLVVGTGLYFVGNYFTTKYIDMSLWDCFGVIHDLTSVKSKKLVNNQYSDSDYTAFDSELKGQLFLNENADFSIGELLAALTGSGESAGEDEGKQEGEQEVQSAEGYFVRSAESLGASIDGNTIEHLTELFVRENLDLEALREYDAEKHSETNVFRVTDRMLAAALDKATDQIARGIPPVANYLDRFGIKKASEVLKFEQVVFGSRSGTLNGQAATVKTLSVTVSVDARKVGTAYLKMRTHYDLGFLCKAFLPKRIYATAVVPVEENATVENNVYINNMDDKKMDRAFKLVDNITEITGTRMELKDKVSAAMNGGEVGSVINKVSDIFPIDKAENHTVSLDIFESLINLGGFNKVNGELKEEEKQIHASDLIYTMGGLVASDMEDAIKEEYDFEHQWRDSTTNKVVYDRTLNPGSIVEGKTWEDYRQLFMNEVAAKYLLELVIKKEGEPDYTVTFDDLMRLFGLGGSNSEGKNIELLDLFNAKRLHETTGMSTEQRKVKIDSRMLGAILQSQINSLIDGGGSLGGFDPELVYVYTYDEYVGDIKHNMMETAISVDAALLLNKGGTVASVMTGLIGERVIITFNVDITPDAENYIKGELKYNGITNQKTDSILKTISAFVSDFDKQSLLGQVEQPIRNTMHNMNDVIRIEICSSKIDLDATMANELPTAIELPTIFETIKQMMFKDDDAEVGDINVDITPERIEAVMLKIDEVNNKNFESGYIRDDGVTMLYDDEGNLVLDDDGNPVTSYARSLDIIIDKYFIGDKEDGSKYTTFDELFGTNGAGGAVDSSDFKADNFRFDDLYHDNRPIDAADDTEDLHPKFDDNDLAALLIEKMHKDGTGIYEDIKDIRGLRIEVSGKGEYLTLYVLIDTHKLIDKNSKDKARLLPADTMYLKATVDLGSIAYYKKYGSGDDVGKVLEPDEEIPEGEEANYKKFYRTELTVNEMNEDEYGWLNLMTLSLGKRQASALDLKIKACDIGSIVFDQIETLRKSIGSDITFVNGGIELVTVYDFLKKSFNSTADTETIRAAIQGLAAEKQERENSDYNYRGGDILVNGLYADEIDLGLGTISMPDNEFGKMLSGGFTVAGVHVPGTLAQSENGAFELVQLNILHRSLGARGGFISSFVTEATDGSVADMLAAITDGTFVEFTFKTTVSRLLDKDAENKLSSVAPEFIYFTILTSKGEDGFEEIYFRINEMNHDSQEVLLGDFLKLDETQITDQITKCISALGKYSDAEYDTVDYVSGGAFGKVTFTQGAVL